MPNGGMLPCCLGCDWADKKELDPLPTVFCTKHEVTIYFAVRLFCSELSKEFAKREGLLDDTIYLWAQVIYKNPEYPTLPQYYDEPVSLIPVSEYAEWDEETFFKAVRNRNKEVEEEFWKKYGRED